jgi:hypothetical protein
MARAKGPFDAVQFTKESAERVARVVRSAELNPSAASPLAFGARFPDVKKIFRVGEFDGTWMKGTDKTVRLLNQTDENDEPVEVTAKNLLYNVFPANPEGSTKCIVGRDGGEWYFTNDERHNCEQSQGAEWLSQQEYNESSSPSQIDAGDGAQVLINNAGCLRWVGLTKRYLYEEIASENNGLRIVRRPVWVFDDVGETEEDTIACTDLGQQITGGTVTIDYGSGTVELTGECASKSLDINITLDTTSCPE